MRSMVRLRRTYNTNLIKKTVCYSTREIADLFGIHKGTVLSWLKAGLPRIDDRRPFLVLGAHLEQFLKKRQGKRKTKCRSDELYCCRCGYPKKVKNDEVILRILNGKVGLLSGLCSDCGTKTNQIISLKKLNQIRNIFTVLKTRNKDLTGSGLPIDNVDLREEPLT